MNPLNTVETSISLAGKKIHFVSLKLTQTFNEHHQCEILVDAEELDKSWMYDPVKIIKYLSESVIVEMKHRQTGESNIFKGIVSNIRMVGKHGQQNYILIHAASETIRLEGKPSMDSFVNSTLEEIVNEVVKTSGSGAEVTVKPKYKKSIDYFSKYQESPFGFFNRLSWLYGEAFYCDGTTIYFGLPNLADAIPIKYDLEITSLDLSANLLPPNFQRYDYLVHDDEERVKPTRQDVPDATGYLRVALDKSESVYTSDAYLPLDAVVNDSDSILKMVDNERTRSIADMLILSGTSQTCKIGIGKVIYVDFPKDMEVTTTAGNFLITETIHTIDQEGHYSNTFSGVRAALEQIPIPKADMPVANSQRAIVVSNADPEGCGRVQIQFQWQRYLNKTSNWVRVQTLDGGSSSVFAKNRGIVFIPEVEDEVMVSFEGSDPSKPYVSGSLFSAKKGKGGEADNHLKSIKTRSGHTIQFDDEKNTWGITIMDDNGNKIYLDTKNGIININSLEQINFISKQINFRADDINSESKTYTNRSSEDLFIYGDKRVSIHSDEFVEIESFENMNLLAKENYLKGTDILEASANDLKIGAESNLLLSGDKTVLNGDSQIEIKSPDINEKASPDQFPFKERVIKKEFIMNKPTIIE